LSGDLIVIGARLIMVSLATQKHNPPKPARDINGNIVEFKDWPDMLGLRRGSPWVMNGPT
jgi:hypothetical protein